jgi:hypothetical protein
LVVRPHNPHPAQTEINFGDAVAFRDFAKSSLRVAVAIFLALLALSLVIALFVWGKDTYDKRQAAPYESLREWSADLKDALGLDVKARTKVVSGTMFVAIDIAGYPAFLSAPGNQKAQLLFDFLDKDGFKLLSKDIDLSEFTTIVNGGERTGLHYQFDQYIQIDTYKRFSRMQVGWTIDTKATPEPQKPESASQPILDHCAPGLSKSERLKRLSQHGTVREASTGEYTAGGRIVQFFYDGSLLICR